MKFVIFKIYRMSSEETNASMNIDVIWNPRYTLKVFFNLTYSFQTKDKTKIFTTWWL
jgi:hypothetical protein